MEVEAVSRLLVVLVRESNGSEVQSSVERLVEQRERELVKRRCQVVRRGEARLQRAARQQRNTTVRPVQRHLTTLRSTSV